MLGIYRALLDWWAEIWNPLKNAAKVELIALRNFSPTRSGSNVLSIKKGDRFMLISDSDEQWWYVKEKSTRRRGFVAKTIVAKSSDEPHLEWISIEASAEFAEHTLSDNKFTTGSFIIRPRTRENISEYLAISVKKLTRNVVQPTFIVAHYVVKREDGEFRMENGSIRFDSLRKLIEHYSSRRNTSNLVLSYSVKKNEAVTPWEFEDRDIEKEGNRLGKGAFGEVFKGTLFRTEVVAVKTFFLIAPTDIILREAEIARRINHENVIRTIGVCKSPLMIITEFMPNGSLYKYLRRSEVHLSDATKLSIALKIASGMAYLAVRNIVHRDLAARNILVGETVDVIKIADFGLARSLNDSGYYRTNADKFPWKWTAPEAHVSKDRHGGIKEGKVTKEADVWSYGILLWEIYSKGAEPFKDMLHQQFMKAIEKIDQHLTRPVDCPKEMHQIMLQCCRFDPKQRPTFEELCIILSEFQKKQIVESTRIQTAVKAKMSRKLQNKRKYRNRFPCRNRYVIRVAKTPSRSLETENIVFHEANNVIHASIEFDGSQGLGYNTYTPGCRQSPL